MTDNKRRREKRHCKTVSIGVYLSRGPDGPSISPVFSGYLTNLSANGASIALDKIMFGAIHLAFGPMESDTLQMNIVFNCLESGETIILPVRPVWLDKKSEPGLPPFHIGVRFTKPLQDKRLKRILQDESHQKA